jgi:hypothetical protein
MMFCDVAFIAQGRPVSIGRLSTIGDSQNMIDLQVPTKSEQGCLIPKTYLAPIIVKFEYYQSQTARKAPGSVDLVS